jgi:uncharacterized protein YidB (DUF937 family)
MGLLDILNGMQNGPRGQSQPSGSRSGGGMSPMTMALLGLLAYKALKSFGGGQPAGTPGGGRPAPVPTGGAGGLGDILGGLLGGQGASSGSTASGGLNDLLRGGLGGLLGGAGAGSILSGGLGNLINDFHNNGQGRAAQSWVGTGPNHAIAPGELESAVGVDTLDALAKQTGMNRNDLLSGLSQQLPDLVDQLTPQGRLPTEEEAQRMV